MIKRLIMARQTGTIKITGTIDGITFYRMNDAYYARTKSSLSRKKVKTHPHFARTRQYAQWLGEASKMASVVYRSLPATERNYELYRELKTIAYSLLKCGTGGDEVMEELRRKVKGRRRKAEGGMRGERGKRYRVKGGRPPIVSKTFPAGFYRLSSLAKQGSDGPNVTSSLCICGCLRVRGGPVVAPG